MLKVNKLTKVFLSADNKVSAVKDVSMDVPDGVFSTIVGKSGSGKSTLLSLLGALDKPTSGSIEVGGEDVTRMGDSKLIKYRRDKIGFIFQNYNLIPNLTALENVTLPMEFAGIKKEERIKRAESLLKQVGLDLAKQNRKPGRLSGGEQQRVAIARALANKPKLILADEPTGNLDSATGKIIIDLLKDLARTENTTIVAVTHDEGIAKQAKITFTLKDGRLV
ncbi:TPA: ABC transporter ATP-binding protein [Candidatus Berkelbacteria bacterium]|uniref:ABC transporter-like protein, putative ABC transport system ATP-binding protein n=1 Tax=Berkelbacteria bacterium GW2011_GWE1_39_12 TaxID=1618337 RepID=A0A0G4B447_9BACT|nr:MAG: ABC transporter-like protein, putative ABC transport system ATP-binding protein [Berkelbacteria bacterium GW2011_GWE1_39_12]HBO60264.1 ABC transporter ATP-binding protein [Candidatus Berkelbacteria bacterium]